MGLHRPNPSVQESLIFQGLLEVTNEWRATNDDDCKIARNFDPTSKVSQRIDLVAKDWNWEVIFRVQP